MAAILLSGCNSSSPSSTEKNNPKKSKTEITIYSSYQDEFFYRNYGNYLIQKYPDVRFKLIQSTSRNKNEMIEEINKVNPDIIVTWRGVFQDLQKKNMLVDLVKLAETHNIDFKNYYPEMINTLQNDTGQLNGLAPSVTPSVLFYNKTIFDSNQMSYPINQMSWDELLLLSQRFIGTETKGLTGVSPLNVLAGIAHSKKWNIVDPQNNALVFDSEQWIRSIQNIINSAKKQNLVHDSGELFLDGKSAMHYGTLNLVKDLNAKSFSWDIVTSPVDDINRDQSSDINFYDIFCIPQNSSQKEVAWNLIQSILDEDAVTYIQKNNYIPGSISTLNKYMNSQYDVDLSAIWKQKINNTPYLSSKLSQEYIDKFDDIVHKILNNAVQDQNITASEYFRKIEIEAKNIYEQEVGK